MIEFVIAVAGTLLLIVAGSKARWAPAPVRRTNRQKR